MKDRKGIVIQKGDTVKVDLPGFENFTGKIIDFVGKFVSVQDNDYDMSYEILPEYITIQTLIL